MRQKEINFLQNITIHQDNIPSILKRMLNEKIYLSKETPVPQMRLFNLSYDSTSIFFETEEELIQYINSHHRNFDDIDDIYIIELLGTIAGQNDVIKKTYKNGNTLLFTAIDEDGYGIYNEKRSIQNGVPIWKYHYGEICELYSAFREKGITFKNDVYAKIETRNKKIFKICRDLNLFNTEKNE